MALVFCLAWSTVWAQDGAITIAPGDTVEISVLGRPDLDGRFQVRSDGFLSVHLLGSIEAAGMTEAALEDRIQQGLTASLQSDMSVRLEMVEFRPVYALGDVAVPGAHVYHPGMTALQLIATAGGFSTLGPVPQTGGISPVQQASAERQLAETLVQLLRLEAEERGDLEIQPTQEFLDLAGTDAAILLQEQQNILRYRVADLAGSLTQAQTLADLAWEGVINMSDNLDVLRNQVARSEREVRRLEGMRESGVLSTDRMNEIEALSAVRSELTTNLVNEAVVLRDATSLASEPDALRRARGEEIAQQRVLLASQERALRAQLARNRAVRLGPSGGGTWPEDGSLEVVGLRTVNGEMQSITLSPDTPLAPGDVVEITILDRAAR